VAAGTSGHAWTRSRARAVREALAATLAGAAGVEPAAGGVPAAGAVAGLVAGDITGVGPAAGGMSAPHGLMTAFNTMHDGYLPHLPLADVTARMAALRERGPFKPAQVEPFKAGPVDIMVFDDMLERCLKLTTTITVERYFGDNEELGWRTFSAFSPEMQPA